MAWCIWRRGIPALRLEVTRGVRGPLMDFELRGKQIRDGQTIDHLIGAANRNPSVFVDPDRVDITRYPDNHVGFGIGIHFCLGRIWREWRAASPFAPLRDACRI